MAGGCACCGAVGTALVAAIDAALVASVVGASETAVAPPLVGVPGAVLMAGVASLAGDAPQAARARSAIIKAIDSITLIRMSSSAI